MWLAESFASHSAYRSILSTFRYRIGRPFVGVLNVAPQGLPALKPCPAQLTLSRCLIVAQLSYCVRS